MVPQVDRNTETSPAGLGQGRGVADRNPDMLRSAEAARYIDMFDSWLRQTRMAGRTDGPPFLRQGRAIRYRRCDLDQWLERRLCGGDVKPPEPPPVPAPRPQSRRKPPTRGKRGARRARQ
jgi:hypothetical protein